MKPNKTLFGAFVISVTLIESAPVSKPNCPTPPRRPLSPAPAAEFVADDSDLSAGHAAAVARIFRNGNRPTRAGSDAVVRNVVTIRDAAGRPAIYAVNLQEGYLLISATKRCYPILAQIDRGTFTLDREPSGLDVVLQEMTETIEAARDSAAVFDCRSAWLPYEERTRPERVQTRMTDDEFYDIQNEWYGKWFAEGADTYRLASKPDEMPEDAYQRFCETAIGDDAWVDTPYNCMESGVITVKYHESGTKKGPFLTTKWGQRNGYNALFENKDQPLGCVTIAVGQLMRYYQHPAYFGCSVHARRNEQYDPHFFSDAIARRTARNRRRIEQYRPCETGSRKLRIQLLEKGSERLDRLYDAEQQSSRSTPKGRTNLATWVTLGWSTAPIR